MDDRTDSYWRDFLKSGSVSDYLKYAVLSAETHSDGSADKQENSTEG